MDKKKILIVCYGFYPDNSPRSNRATELAKEFALLGHEVVVLTPKKPEHFAFEKEYQIQIKDLGKPGWKVPNFGSSKPGYILTRMAVRFFQLSLEYPGIELMFKVKKALRKERNYDLIISNPPYGKRLAPGNLDTIYNHLMSLQRYRHPQ